MVDGTQKFPLSKPEKKCWMATMACAAEFQEAESFLTEKTTPLHANAPERPKTSKNDRKPLNRSKIRPQQQKAITMTNPTKQVNKGES